MRLPRLQRAEEVVAVFNRLAADLERLIRPFAANVVTLADGSTSTIVESSVVRPTSTVILTPADAAAAANQDWYVEPGVGEFVITHGNAASPRSLHYLVV